MATLEMNVRQVNSDFQAIKDKIVEHGVEVADGTRTAEYASKVDDVFEAGKKAEYDAFWDAYQKNGTRKNYYHSFSDLGWTNEIFKPKYDIVPTNVSAAFVDTHIEGDLAEILKNCGVVLDTSNCTDFDYAFATMFSITRLPTIDMRAASSTTNVFCWSVVLETIDKIIVKADGSITFDYWFYGCTHLANVIFEGVIGQAIDFQWSTLLSHDSIVSVVTHLSTTATGMTATFSKTAVNNAFETSEGAADGSTSTEWTALIGTKTNWTISLV